MDNNNDTLTSMEELTKAKKASEKRMKKYERKLMDPKKKSLLLGLIGIPLGIPASLMIYGMTLLLFWAILSYESNNYVWGSIDGSPMPGIGTFGFIILLVLGIPLIIILFFVSAAVLFALISLISYAIVELGIKNNKYSKYEKLFAEEIANMEEIDRQIELLKN